MPTCAKACYVAGVLLFNLAVSAGTDAGQPDSRTLFAISENTAVGEQEQAWHNLPAEPIVSQHDIVIDLRTLRGETRDESSEKEPLSSRRLGHTVRVYLPLIEKPIDLRVEKVAEYVPGVVTYSGRTLDVESGIFTLSEKDGQVLGKILIGHLTFIIEPPRSKANSHLLTVLDRALFSQDPNHTLPRTADMGFSSESTIQTTSTGSGEVRVLFLFASDISNPSQMAANIVSEFNAALSRSGVASANQLTSANVRTVSSSFSGSTDCKGKLLYDMHKRDGVFASLDTWMAGDFADVVHLVASTVEPFSARPCPSDLPPVWNAPSRIGGASTGFYPGTLGSPTTRQTHSQLRIAPTSWAT